MRQKLTQKHVYDGFSLDSLFVVAEEKRVNDLPVSVAKSEKACAQILSQRNTCAALSCFVMLIPRTVLGITA